MRRATPATSPHVTAAKFLAVLLGESPRGLLCMGLGEGGFYNARGSYDFPAGVQHFYFHCPRDLDEAAEFVSTMREAGDVYIAPQLLRQDPRSNANAKPSRWLHVDVDHELSGTQKALLSRLQRRSHLLVESGTPGHFHLYVELRRRPSASDGRDLSRRLAAGLGGEKWEASAFLRAPGSLNHKSAAAGGNPSQVVLAANASALKPWNDDELDRLLPPAGPPATSTTTVPSPPTRSLLDNDVPARLALLMQEGIEEDRKSDQFFHLVMTAIEQGFGHDDILVMANSHAPTTEKWKPTHIETRVADLCDKHPHPGRTCRLADCSNTTDAHLARPDVSALCAAVRAAAVVEDWGPRRQAKKEIVLAACLFAEEFGRDFYMSQREFATAAGVERTTFRRWLPELDDWLEVVDPGGKEAATLYRLRLPAQHDPQSLHPPLHAHMAVCGPTWGAERDTFRHGGLGPTAKRVLYEALGSDKLTAAEVAEKLHIALATARRNLNKLLDAGLASRGGDGRWAAKENLNDVKWDVLALRQNKLGKAASQEQRTLQDRRGRHEAEQRKTKQLRDEYLALAQLQRTRGMLKTAAYWALAARIEQQHLDRLQVQGGVVGVGQAGTGRTVGGDIARKHQQQYEAQRAEKGV